MPLRQGKLTKTVWKRSVKKPLCQWEKTGENLSAYESNCFLVGQDDGGRTWISERTVCSASFCAPAWGVLGAAGELAAAGIVPEQAVLRFLLPEGSEEETVRQLSEAAGRMCHRLHLSIADIQAEVCSGVNCTVVSAVVSGSRMISAERQTGAVFPEQEILLCGYTGLEGTLRILEEAGDELSRRFVPSFLSQTESRKEDLILPEMILELWKEKRAGLTAVRQITDGGILAALWDLTEQSGNGMDVSMAAMELRQETVEICEFFQLNPYLLTSAGSFLLAVRHAEPVLEILEKAGIRAGRLGVIREAKARMITSGEEVRYLDRPAQDELIRWQAERFRR